MARKTKSEVASYKPKPVKSIADICIGQYVDVNADKLDNDHSEDAEARVESLRCWGMYCFVTDIKTDGEGTYIWVNAQNDDDFVISDNEVANGAISLSGAITDFEKVKGKIFVDVNPEKFKDSEMIRKILSDLEGCEAAYFDKDDTLCITPLGDTIGIGIERDELAKGGLTPSKLIKTEISVKTGDREKVSLITFLPESVTKREKSDIESYIYRIICICEGKEPN